ncbi:hypothetical protein BD289DRAFT_481714 [Coniella lustricola]|uniref:Amine oxidase domain-containing protein n=1 Tax=Coniella lustricola TaxID=2025994 RepID=A0A2T3ABJ2_9PEZI|nr:hypothetical protein BD289DRAFT_481714 [Coniella lustricola]
MLSRQSTTALRAPVASRANFRSTTLCCCCASCRPLQPASPLSSAPRPVQRRNLYSSHAHTHPIRLRSHLTTTTPSDPGLALTKTRNYATTATSKSPPPKDIAILGGGLTGLTTAYYLTRFHPTAKITIYEASDRIGGWVDTERVSVKTIDGRNAAIAFERGARAVSPQKGAGRWEDFVLFDLIDQLGLNQPHGDRPAPVFKVSKDDPILCNRYIYYPDHLVSLPGPPTGSSVFTRIIQGTSSLFAILTEPLFTGLWAAGRNYYTKTEEMRSKYARSKPTGEVPQQYQMSELPDVSTGQFLENFFGGPAFVNNAVSAMYHGIWGGDVWSLSVVSTTLQNLYIRIQHQMAGVITKDHDYQSGRDLLMRNPRVVDVWQELGKGTGYLGFLHGFDTLTQALANKLKQNPNVSIKTGAPVSSLGFDKKRNKTIVSSSVAGTRGYDKVISSLYSGTLANLAGDALPELKKSQAVTIQIVNLWYPRAELNHPHRGFGYLIPQSVPLKNNPHAALGVIFDSDRDLAAGDPEAQNVGGTKLTVMLGGHYWRDLPTKYLPNAAEAATMAIDTVRHHLGIPENEPVYTSSKVCRECIPQHLVHHRTRMATAHTQLQNAFGGTLAVVGGSYTSPGVLPSLKAARDMALKVSGQGYKGVGAQDMSVMSNMDHVGETGLGRFHGKNEAFRFLSFRDTPFHRGQRPAFHFPI